MTEVQSLGVPSSLNVSFPVVDTKALMKAFALDSKFKGEDVTVRGFVYVMKDLTHRCVETGKRLYMYILYNICMYVCVCMCVTEESARYVVSYHTIPLP